MKINKGILIQIAIIILAVALIIFMVNNDFDLILFKIYSTASLDAKNEELNNKVNALDSAKNSYKAALTNLEDAKSNYSKEKARYEGIEDSTIATIREATQGEVYYLEYIWVSLGNYALANNLSISLYEPSSTSVDNYESTNQTSEYSNSTQVSDNVSLETLKIQVQGTYLNVSEFIYDVESDSELRFKLDNIRMEYAENNKITAIFEVTGLELKK